MNLSIVFLFVAFIAIFILWADFRKWISNQLDALWQLIQILWPTFANWLQEIWRNVVDGGKVYTFILAIVTAFSFLLLAIALLINNPTFTAIAFVFALTLMVLAWLPGGLVLKLFGVEKDLIPKFLKTVVAWLAFLGFVAMAIPDLITLRLLMGVALIGFITLGLTVKINVLDKLVVPFLIIMILALFWKNIFPESYRSSIRYTVSLGKRFSTIKDRGSINNETDAATTYGVTLKDISVLYLLEDTEIKSVEVDLKESAVVRIVSHKDEIFVYDGQGLIQIQLPRENGSFIGGNKFWVEAEFIQLATPRQIVSKKENFLSEEKYDEKKEDLPSVVKDSIFTRGVYEINFNGQTPYNIIVYSEKKCGKYSLSSKSGNGYLVVYDDGKRVYDSPDLSVVFPHQEIPKFKLLANEPVIVKLVVS